MNLASCNLNQFHKCTPKICFACLDFHYFQMGMCNSGSLGECGETFLSVQSPVNSHLEAGTAEVGFCGWSLVPGPWPGGMGGRWDGGAGCGAVVSFRAIILRWG